MAGLTTTPRAAAPVAVAVAALTARLAPAARVAAVASPARPAVVAAAAPVDGELPRPAPLPSWQRPPDV